MTRFITHSFFLRSFLLVLLPFFSSSIFATEFYELSVERIKGPKPTLELSEYRKKVVLIVNIASKCGYTPQLQGLEKLYQDYKSQGLVVLGVPSNQFLGQTPEDDKDLAEFCSVNYGVTFPLTKKALVRGKNKMPLYSFLMENSERKKEVSWNFEKYLIDKNGKIAAWFPKDVDPLDKKIVDKIKSLL